jgi:E3 ubiquitin-protein ligase TRIP12
MDDDDPMTNDAQWVDEPSGSNSGPRMREEELDPDDHMGDSGHDDDDENHSDDDENDEDLLGGPGGSNPYSRLARMAGETGMQLDEATAAALFGGDFRSFGGMMSGMMNRFKSLKSQLKSKNPVTRLAALRECSELLLVSNEDTLGGSFSTSSFATEFIAILKGEPNIDDKAEDPQPKRQPAELDEDAQLAAALAMSTGGSMPSGMGMPEEDEMECQLVACRCLAHLMEALPGSGHTLVHLGAVPVLCSKLMEISYIELAEQTLSVSSSMLGDPVLMANTDYGEDLGRIPRRHCSRRRTRRFAQLPSILFDQRTANGCHSSGKLLQEYLLRTLLTNSRRLSYSPRNPHTGRPTFGRAGHISCSPHY